jgi:hypothetical protein
VTFTIHTSEELIQNPEYRPPHLVLLGAGASCASFPNGDANGKKLLVMANFSEILNLDVLLKDENIVTKNFEEIYPDLKPEIQKKLEEHIEKYFSNLQLPNTATHYDRLLLSLRKKDVIFTFNWDPFLFDAYERNRCIDSLPQIFFLHGNVRIGYCVNHDSLGRKNTFCDQCRKKYSDVPLLYPITKKDYFNSHSYIKSTWEEAAKYFSEAFTITIFGYGAPESDVEAVELLRKAWFEKSDRKAEHIEIIDIGEKNSIYERWKPFTPTQHFKLITSFEGSRLFDWPRRTCEALFYPMTRGEPCEKFPLPKTEDLNLVRQYVNNIAIHES